MEVKVFFKGLLILAVFLLLSVVTGCKTQKVIEVPIKQSEKITERLLPIILPPDSALFDALLACDSLNNVYVRELNESKTPRIAGNWRLNENRLIYKTIVKKDTIYMPQTEKEVFVEVPVKIEIVKEVNVLTTWQTFQIWCGRIAGGLTGILLIFITVKSKYRSM